MQLGLIGLGKMGGNMRERLRLAGHEVIGYDINPAVSDVKSLAELVKKLEGPRIVWTMVAAGQITRDTVAKLADLLEPGDLVIDGGNSRFTDDFENEKLLKAKGIGYVDCGVSGGIWGLKNGYGLMVGGTKANVKRAMPIFDALRPEGPRDEGFVHAGKVGAGHYTKMVHNGIEYGLMAAYAEGYELLARKDIVEDVPGAFKAWTRGTVVRSWLLDLLVEALEKNPTLADVSDYTVDSGEGKWTVEEAIALDVPMPVISASLFARFASRQQISPTMQAVAALRGGFGGHQVMTIAEGMALRAASQKGDETVKRAARKSASPKVAKKAAAPGTKKRAAAKKAAQKKTDG
jgi:6-phosphogluconate dehydrogenase